MRKTLLLAIAGGSLLLMALAPIVAGDDDNEFKASLNGYHEVTSISTPARGSFSARLNDAGTTLRYKLTLRGFTEPVLFAHIHFAEEHTNGNVVAFLCGGGSKPAACPTDGVVEGTIVAADVLTPGRGLVAGEFGELIRAMRNGATYVNAHTNTYQPGEIRGQIRRDD